jgi:ubiquinone/menaquinone biosynthesis C-methylase UbiE
VGLYNDHILPRLVSRACGSEGMRRWRAKVANGVVGDVVEIGFGSGLNLSEMSSQVKIVYAVEPSVTAMNLAAKRIREAPMDVVHIGLDGGSIDLADASCDAAICTFTLCTVPDPHRALAELHRVLRPGARLHFLEHGIAPDDSVARWQRRIDPWQVRFADGCHLTRDPSTMVTESGFELERVTKRYAKGPRPWSYFTLGVARRVDT